MLAIDFIRKFEQRYNVKLRGNNRITARGAKLTDAQRELLKLHRRELLDALHGDVTAELKATVVEEKDFESVGLFTIDGGKRLTHDLGDDYADDILSGLIPIDAARAEVKHADDAERRLSLKRMIRWLLLT
jgi:hypothetical protein